MACFIVPAGEAVVTEIVSKIAKKKEGKTPEVKNYDGTVKIPFSTKMSWLTKMLTGGSVLLAFEHVWHGEITPTFPFLTATADAQSTTVMLHEMATNGVGMMVAVTAVWAGILAIVHIKEKGYAQEMKEETSLEKVPVKVVK